MEIKGVDYQKLWNEETKLTEQLQKDKDFMDIKLMRIKELINKCLMHESYRQTILYLIDKARGRV